MPGGPNKLSHFWQELKRRKVVRVITIYAAVAFVILQLVDIIAEPLNLPSWVMILVIIILGVGFPITIVFSWIYDITSKGITRTETADLTAGGEVVIQKNEEDTGFKNSIAVLPFENMSPHKDQEYFCDGLTEEIITALSHVESLKVISRTSVFAFKGKQKDIRNIGQKLNVNTLLEGSIRKEGNRLRITAQLIKASDGSHIWSQTYDRELKNVFQIQEEISLAIAENLKIKLDKKEREAILSRKESDPEAFDAYLKQMYLDTGTKNNLKAVNSIRNAHLNKNNKATSPDDIGRMKHIIRLLYPDSWLKGIILIVILILTVSLWYIWPFITLPELSERSFASSVAVLEFDDESPGTGYEKFAKGISDDISLRLSRIENLKVVPVVFPSEMGIIKQKPPVRAICRDFDVMMVLKGNVRIENQKITVSAELIDGPQNIPIWQRTFTGNLQDIITIHDSIVSELVQSINEDYSSNEVQEKISRRLTSSFTAYELYLRGNQELTKWTQASIVESRKFYSSALDYDPNFVDALSNLAFANLSSTFLFHNDALVIDSIKNNAKAALSIENDNEVALISMLGYYLMNFNMDQKLSVFDYRDMILYLKKLVSNKSSSPMAFFGMAHYYLIYKKDYAKGREYLNLALDRCEQMLKMDPSNGIVNGLAAQSAGLLGLIAFRYRDFTEAVNYTEYSIKLMPGISRTYQQLSSFYIKTEQYQKGIEILNKAASYTKDPVEKGNVMISLGSKSMMAGIYQDAGYYLDTAMILLKDPSTTYYDYALLTRYFISYRLNEFNKADSLIKQRLAKRDLNSWPEPIISYYAGETSEEKVLRLANKNWKKCEALFYIAEKNLMEGDTLKAQMYLEDCLRTRVTTYHEYDMAKAELRAIKGGSQEP